MAKSFRHIRYQQIRPKSMDKKSLGAISSTKPKISEIKISEAENISPTTGKKRDEEERKEEF